MRKLMLIGSLLLLGACSTVDAKSDADSSVVRFAPDGRNVMVAQRVDGVPVNNGRYFRLQPGHRDLQVLVIKSGEENVFPHDFVTLDYEFAAGVDYELRVFEQMDGRHRTLELRQSGGAVLKRFVM